MRIPRWLIIALMVVGVSLIGVYIVALLTQYQPLLTGLGQSLPWIGGSIIGGLTLMLNIFKYLNEVEEKRKVRLREHTKILNDEVYRKLSYICVEPHGSYGRKRQLEVPIDVKEYDRYELETRLRPLMIDEIPRPQLIRLSRLESLKLGTDNLKHPSYRNIYNAWTKLESLIEEYNSLVDSLDKELTQAVRKKCKITFANLLIGNLIKPQEELISTIPIK
jgi:hypothetical protein